MEKNFDHKKSEPLIAKMWQDSSIFKANTKSGKKPYSILIPPPNASGKMHTGNVLMIAIEDLLIRWKRMSGYEAMWLPGTDHAGFETQITFERELSKQKKSRFDYDRATLYSMIHEFVLENKGNIEKQIVNMGASVDWSRYTFTLDDKVVSTVCDTFKKFHEDDLLERRSYLVNYCPKCGTTFADLEMDHVERKDSFYYVKYPIVGEEGKFVTVATVRPETIFADMWLAVNPKDKSKKALVGKKVLNPLTNEEIEIISDNFVDPKFGTGVVKITPAHDKNDFEVGIRQGLYSSDKNLQMKVAIAWNAKLTDICILRTSDGTTESIAGLNIKMGREKTVEFLKAHNLLEKEDTSYTHSVSVCYKGGHDIEPMVMPNWFVKVQKLKEPAYEAVKSGVVKIYPKWREKTYLRWMEEMRDWPISRQVVWGIRIPVWYKVNGFEENITVLFIDKSGQNKQGTVKDLVSQGYTVSEIKNGLQRLFADTTVEYLISQNDPFSDKKEDYLPETDTFDTWFSSGQWPLVTLGYPNSDDFKFFYPTSVLETGWEIIRFWVSRMIMFGMYLTKDIEHEKNFEGKGIPPFEHVYLHGMVRALDGRKMSKSLGNVINPDDYQDKFGTDALRMGLISGTANGKDFAFPHDKVIGYQKFGNKIWNMARFMTFMKEQYLEEDKDAKLVNLSEKEYGLPKGIKLTPEDKALLKNFKSLVKSVGKNLDKYRFSEAAESIYQFMWHEMADVYIESLKNRTDKAVALAVIGYVYFNCLRVLHPFMPFVTETIWQELRQDSYYSGFGGDLLAGESWPVL